MERREVFKILAASAVAEEAFAQHAHAEGKGPFPGTAGYKMKFFTAAEEGIADRLSEIIIPGEAGSPGAREARVVHFLDLFAFYGGTAVQQRWRAGLAGVNRVARSRFGKEFMGCSGGEAESIVAAMAAGEGNPVSEEQHFFALLKQRTVDGFRYSQVGLEKFFEYKGDVPSREFGGCTHEEHKRA